MWLFQERHSQDYQTAQAKGFCLRVDELTAKLMLAEEELGKANTEIRQLKMLVSFMSRVILILWFHEAKIIFSNNLKSNTSLMYMFGIASV